MIKNNLHVAPGILIWMLNPILRGWANYHRHASSKQIFQKIDCAIFKSLWKWCRRRHPRKPRRWIKEKYFHTIGDRHWVFSGEMRLRGETRQIRLYSLAYTPIRRHTKIKGEANPYDPQWEKYFEQRLDVKTEGWLRGLKMLLFLWREQEGKCPVCQERITKLTGWQTHHLMRKRIAGEREEARKLRQQAQKMPSRDPNDPNFRRLWYCRYADDWLLGFSGPLEEAEQIKAQLAEFLREQLKLELSQEKTLITHARTKAARFLGYEIVSQGADDKHCRKVSRRRINGAPGLKVPVDVIRAKCSKYMKRGKPIQRAERLSDSDFTIVGQYQAEYRGVVQYYLQAFNVHRLWKLHRVMKLSLAKTLADKHRSSVRKMIRKYQTVVSSPHGTLKALEVIQSRGADKKPLVARFGGIELRRQKHAVMNDRPPQVYNSLRSELIQRLLAEECELCGSELNCEVHHIRKLADLNQPGRKEKPLWMKRMATRRRKTLVVCQKCHEEIHRERPSRRKSTTQITGKPT